MPAGVTATHSGRIAPTVLNGSLTSPRCFIGHRGHASSKSAAGRRGLLYKRRFAFKIKALHAMLRIHHEHGVEGIMSRPATKFEGRFIWNTHGDWIATLVNGHLWDPAGNWIGWVEGEDVYKADGEWIGTLSRDGRILRRRSELRHGLHPRIPPTPPKPDLPALPPLPPLFAELSHSVVDVLERDPDIFKRLSDLRRDIGE